MVLARVQGAQQEDIKNRKETREKMCPPIKNGADSIYREPRKAPLTPRWEVAVMGVILLITFVSMPTPLQPEGKPTLQHVFYYGWLTALSTGLGVFPLVFVPDLKSYWIGISNAVAAGMMIAASYSLALEGWTYTDPHDQSEIPTSWRTILGAALGLGFIFGTKNFLDEYEDLKVGGLQGTNARKALLVFFVMTLHSFSEGLGVGVSFGGQHGSELGLYISASLAVHNIPEGLAIAVVLLPRGTNKLEATLWAIATSLPQPIMAVPAYMFVNHFVPVLPIGLGFAAGAMLWVAFMELMVEAIRDSNILTTTIISSLSFAFMQWCHNAIDDEARS